MVFIIIKFIDLKINSIIISDYSTFKSFDYIYLIIILNKSLLYTSK